MQRCPSCNAELTARPCAACGWPERAAAAAPAEGPQAAGRGGWCAGCSGALAVLASLATFGFYRLGEAHRWTSESLFMLIVWAGLAVFGAAALVFWALALEDVVPRWFRDD